ncbi:MAG: CHAT domain-containing protein [Actinomycetia bacterium]|nr:CHAT domain-containing protein [Actinomycetes bacterium]
MSESARLLAEESGPLEERTSLLHWIQGLALHELGDIRGATEAFNTAISVAREIGSTSAEARALANLAITMLQQGDTDAGHTAIERASKLDAGAAEGTVKYLLALFEQRLGNHRRAFELYQQALPLLARENDQASVAGLHLNRGVLFAYQNDLVQASRNYAEAESIARRQDLILLEAMAAHNLGFTLGRMGALAEALDTFDRARGLYSRLPYAPRQLRVLHTDHADALLAAGLGAGAEEAARGAVDALYSTGNSVDLAEARLLLARVCLANGKLADAHRLAKESERDFNDFGRRSWAAMAGYVDMLARAAVTSEPELTPPAQLVELCATTADRLGQAGWTVESMDARFWAARLAAQRSDVGRAERELATARALRGRLSPAQVINRWHAHAVYRLAAGDIRKASRAVAAGLHEAEVYRSQMGSTAARVEATTLAMGLAQTGVEIAFRRASPAAVFRAAERTRATVTQLTPVVPPSGSPIALELDRLRSEVGQRLTAPDSLRAAASGPADIERAITDLALRTQAEPVVFRPTSLTAIRSQLRHRVLVEYIEHRQHLHAIVATRSRTDLVDLGPLKPVQQAQTFLDASLQQLLRRGSEHTPRAKTNVTRNAAELSELLIDRLGLFRGRRSYDDLVIVPTGSLHWLAWSLLPGLRDRDFCVAPSASLWFRRTTATAPSNRRVLLVCGPELPGAEIEIERLAALNPAATVLAGSEASNERVTAELARADVAHIAAHGLFRSDNPMFSSLSLADGPLTIYDLERLDGVPSTVILTACDAATPAVTMTDEVIGTASALLSLGVTTVFAPIAPVPDGSLEHFVVDFHQALMTGASVRGAHRIARGQAWRHHDALASTTAHCFLPIGAG